MSGDAKKGGDKHHHGHAPWVWIVLGVLVGGFAVWLLMGFMLFADNNIPGARPTPRPGQAARQFSSEATSCPMFSRTHNTCAFGKAGTLAIGSDEAGLHFCYSVPYGPNETYTRYRYTQEGAWAVWARWDEPGVVFAQRFVANGKEASVEYWLSDNPNCSN